MENSDDLPEFHVDDDGNRVSEPAYEALEDCYMMWTSEAGQTGPTLVYAGSRFFSSATPCHQWKPLNKAAGECKQNWLDSLPDKGEDIPQEFIMQAAMTLRPREGDPDFSYPEWSAHVNKLARTLAAKARGGTGAYIPRTAPAYNASRRNVPVMPFASSTGLTPLEPGRPPPSAAQHLPQSPIAEAARARRASTKPAMPNTEPAMSPQQVQS